eukprot:364674-Chlamydomonas_euryale.AAC.2
MRSCSWRRCVGVRGGVSNRGAGICGGGSCARARYEAVPPSRSCARARYEAVPPSRSCARTRYEAVPPSRCDLSRYADAMPPPYRLPPSLAQHHTAGSHGAPRRQRQGRRHRAGEGAAGAALTSPLLAWDRPPPFCVFRGLPVCLCACVAEILCPFCAKWR